jgi:hypothetical protein
MHILRLVWALLLLGAAVAAYADLHEADTNGDGKTDQWIERVDGKLTMVKTDRNHDGVVDHTVAYDEDGRKSMEEMDFNLDGKIDDYSYYESGTLTAREIDSNNDGRVDLWVYLSEGVYIRRYERDTDHDGTPDIVQDYDAE